MSLDRMDKRILKALQKDGRIGNAELAKKLGMSATACWNHTKRLMDEGYVKEVRAILDPEKLGLPVLVTVGVVLDRSTPESFAEFERRCARSPPCRSACCWPANSITGSSCGEGPAGLQPLHANTLLRLPGVRQLRSFFVLNEVKNNPELVVE
jgi:Lrp/AsnC family leucine-responsive transcriptional regulator